MVQIGLAREDADDLAHALCRKQGRQPSVAVAGVVVDDRESRAPCSISASISADGMPALPKPPIMTVVPSCTSATALTSDS